MGSTSVSTAASGSPSIRDLFDLFKNLVLQSPVWVRVIVVLIMLGLITVYVLHAIGVYPPAPAAPVNYSLLLGKQVAGEGDKSMGQATLDLQADAAESRWHDDHPEDSPPLKKVFQIAEDNYLAYRFFDKSDHCVFVIRRESGNTSSRWLRDPMRQTASERGSHSQERRTNESFIARLMDGLVPSAEAATLSGAASANYALMAQGACVSGAHPGQFTWWWGAPEDQCWAPMYRQWKDGCKHFQRYNKCSNAWDDSIHWVSCAAPPHG